jgi:hypothetical protein
MAVVDESPRHFEEVLSSSEDIDEDRSVAEDQDQKMTEDQDQKLMEVLTVLGETVDPDVVRSMLESVGWDVQVVINNLLEDGAPSAPPAPPAPPATQQQQVPALMDHDELTKLPVREIRSMLDARQVDHSTCVEKQDLVKLLEDNWDKEPVPTSSRQSSSRQSSAYSARGADPMPDFIRQMMSSGVFSMSGFPPEAFCQQGGSLSPEEQAERDRRKEEEARVNAERRTELDIQNMEFQESLLIDQQKEDLRKEVEDQERQVQDAKRRTMEESEQVFEAKRQRVSQPEADKADPKRCQIVIRTPSGKRLMRTFLNSDGISFLYDWVDVSCKDEEFTQSNYKLVSRVPGKPSKEICQNSTTLEDEGVEHQTMFFVTCSD